MAIRMGGRTLAARLDWLYERNLKKTCVRSVVGVDEPEWASGMPDHGIALSFFVTCLVCHVMDSCIIQ